MSWLGVRDDFRNWLILQPKAEPLFPAASSYKRNASMTAASAAGCCFRLG